MELAIDITDLKLNGIQQRFSIALTEYASLLESLSGTKEILQVAAQTLGKFYQADDVCLIYPAIREILIIQMPLALRKLYFPKCIGPTDSN